LHAYLPFVAANEEGQLLVLRSQTKRRKVLIDAYFACKCDSGITEISVYGKASMGVSMGATSWVEAKNSNNTELGS